MKKLFGIFILFFIVGMDSWGQTTMIPDSNFRAFLVQNFPTYMTPGQQLINAQAAKYTGNLDCSNHKISNLSGIEKFSKLTSLYCNKNALANLDSVKNLTELTVLDCDSNPLKSLPSLSKLTKLYRLSCGSTSLSALPDLTSNLALTQLYCYNSNIQSIPGLSKLVNLQFLFCYQNPLKTIEDLSNLKNLNALICYSAQLKAIPGLSKLTSLQTLIIGDNPLDTLPDLSKLTQLWMLNVWNSGIFSPPNISTMGQLFTFDFNDNNLTKLPEFKNNLNIRVLNAQNNQLDSVPSLLMLKFLDSVSLGGNKLTQMPDLSASKASLKKIDVSNNQLSALPNFSNYTSLTTLNVQGNQLTFEDLISPSFNPFTTQFLYIPQDSVGKTSSISTREKESFTIVLGIDKSLTSNKYSWYKNGVFVKTTTVDTFAIASLFLADSGVYTCSVSNPAVPFLVLHSYPVQLKIGKCVDLSSFAYQTSDYDCNVGGRVSYQESSISGGTKPYQVRLLSKATNVESIPNGSLFSNLYENSYQLKVTDKNGCSAVKDIQIGGKKTEDCDAIVIVADNSSANNQLYLEEKGTARIFNKTGKLVRTLQTPAIWDGTLQDGELIPGFYMIEHNSRNLTVTVIK